MLTLHLFVIAILISSDTVPIGVYTFHAINSWHSACSDVYAACRFQVSGHFASFVNLHQCTTTRHRPRKRAWLKVCIDLKAAARSNIDTMYETTWKDEARLDRMPRKKKQQEMKQKKKKEKLQQHNNITWGTLSHFFFQLNNKRMQNDIEKNLFIEK